jgi:alkylation response protein AidB-like acyl-CoA dehydrogenase
VTVTVLAGRDTDRVAAADAGLADLLDVCRELAGELRALALAVDADPADRRLLAGSPALELLRVAGTPEPFRAYRLPGPIGRFTESCLARVAANIELARGDVGVLNACAAPSLAGQTVDALGDAAQQELFYRELADGPVWTFFGMTEPEHGSDATAMRTRLDREPDGTLRLTGAKRYVANAARGRIGVVWARIGPTPLSVRAVLLRHPVPGFTAAELDMLGMRGARIGAMTFDGTPVEPDRVLGRHLSASRRGLWGAARAFNVIRLQIAAQALGAALAIADHVRGLRPGWAGLEPMAARLAAARDLLYDSAAALDRDPDDREGPSLAKLHATNLAVEVVGWAEAALGAGALLAEPLLEKWCRDIYGFEFMDGTSNVLRLSLAPPPTRTPPPPRTDPAGGSARTESGRTTAAGATGGRARGSARSGWGDPGRAGRCGA